MNFSGLSATALVAYLFIFLTIPRESCAINTKKVYQKSVKSVLVIEVDEKLIGTGFFISKNLILTNNHVVSGGKKFKIYNKDKKEFTFGEVVYRDPGDDIALVVIEEESKNFLKFSKLDSYSEGEKIFLIGNPGGLEFSITEGIISSRKKNEKEGREILQVSAPALKGSSGSPILNEKAELVGILHSIYSSKQGFNFGAGLDSIGYAIGVYAKEYPIYSKSALRCFNKKRECKSAYTSAVRLGLLKPAHSLASVDCELNIAEGCLIAGASIVQDLGEAKGYSNPLIGKLLGKACKLGSQKGCQLEKASLKFNKPSIIDLVGLSLNFGTNYKISKKDERNFEDDLLNAAKEEYSYMEYIGSLKKGDLNEYLIFGFRQNFLPENAKIDKDFIRDVERYVKNEIPKNTSLEKRKSLKDIKVETIYDDRLIYTYVDVKTTDGIIDKRIFLYPNETSTLVLNMSGPESMRKDAKHLIRQVVDNIERSDGKSFVSLNNTNRPNSNEANSNSNRDTKFFWMVTALFAVGGFTMFTLFKRLK